MPKYSLPVLFHRFRKVLTFLPVFDNIIRKKKKLSREIRAPHIADKDPEVLKPFEKAVAGYTAHGTHNQKSKSPQTQDMIRVYGDYYFVFSVLCHSPRKSAISRRALALEKRQLIHIPFPFIYFSSIQ